MTYTTKISCNKSNLKYIRDFVSDVLEKYNISDVEVNMVVVAIDEVCSNLMIHSHRCNEKETLEVRILKREDGFVFEILDKDELFDIGTYETPSIEKLIKDKSTGGIGLILVKKIMDKIQIEREGKMNVCRLFKTLALANTQR